MPHHTLVTSVGTSIGRLLASLSPKAPAGKGKEREKRKRNQGSHLPKSKLAVFPSTFSILSRRPLEYYLAVVT